MQGPLKDDTMHDKHNCPHHEINEMKNQERDAAVGASELPPMPNRLICVEIYLKPKDFLALQREHIAVEGDGGCSHFDISDEATQLLIEGLHHREADRVRGRAGEHLDAAKTQVYLDLMNKLAQVGAAFSGANAAQI